LLQEDAWEFVEFAEESSPISYMRPAAAG